MNDVERKSWEQLFSWIGVYRVAEECEREEYTRGALMKVNDQIERLKFLEAWEQ